MICRHASCACRARAPRPSPCVAAPRDCGVRPGSPARTVRARRPEDSVLYHVLQQHLTTFLHQASESHDGTGIPRFVEKELRAFLKCGVLAHGFCRFRCTACSFERLVPLSCKGRGFCPSCGGRRMTEISANLTDHVIPLVPVRQIVLSFPHRLRYLLAYDHDRCTGVLRIFLRAVLGFYRRRARARGTSGGRTGSVTFIQRFGSAANLNLHAHVVVLDGVFAEDDTGELRFHQAEAPRDEEIAALLAKIRTRILRHLDKQGLLDDDQGRVDPLSDEAPLLASCYATSIGQRQTVGSRPGASLPRIGQDPDAPWIEHRGPLQAHLDGFDLHASVTMAAQHPEGRLPLERLLRYCARPPIAQDRLKELPDGRIALELKTPWSDGSTHVVYEPLDLIAKLAALVPRPRKNLVLYHGVLAANAAWRERVVRYGRDAAASGRTTGDADAGSATEPAESRRRCNQWAELMRRAFGYDLLVCPDCGGKMALIACILERAAVRKILAHLGLPQEPPVVTNARASPGHEPLFDDVA